MKLALLLLLSILCFGVGSALAVRGSSDRPAAHAGVLAGVRLGPRQVAILAHDAGFRDDDLFTAVAVCGSESSLFTKAHNDNQLEVSAIAAGIVVVNPETGEHITVLNPSTGKVQLSDGSTVFVPLTTSYVVSRDVGLWEINIPASQIGSSVETALYVPANNAAAAFDLWSRRAWQPWVGFTTGVYLNDTYRQWALLGVANRWDAKTAPLANVNHVTRVPWISIPQLRVLYPTVNFG